MRPRRARPAPEPGASAQVEGAGRATRLKQGRLCPRGPSRLPPRRRAGRPASESLGRRGRLLSARHREPSPSGRGLETAQATGSKKAALPQEDLSFSQPESAPWLLSLKKKVKGILRLEQLLGNLPISLGETGNLTTLNLSIHEYPGTLSL